ncbi:MAG: hypothetical protein V1821_02565 [bacterium]
MPYPQVKFSVSQGQDFKTLRNFIKEAPYSNGRNLKWALHEFPKLLKLLLERQISDKELKKFIAREYSSKTSSLKKALRKHEKGWKKIVPKYFLLVDALFSQRVWPRGKYIAYGTIWGMYPRNLEDKTFQIPFGHKRPRYVPVVIAHELLHFIFYEYFYERFQKYHRKKDNFFVWHVSEIFNTLVQNSPTWLKYFKTKSMGYPEHEKIVKRLGRLWYSQKVWDLNKLVDEIIDEVQNSACLRQ